MGFLAKAFKMQGILTRTMGENILYKHKNGVTSEIKAVWNRQYTFVDSDTEAVTTVTAPNIGVRLSDLGAEPKQGDKFRFLDVDYVVTDIHEDGQGAAQLVVHKDE